MMTIRDYHRYYLADPVCFEPPERYPDQDERSAAARRQPPTGWDRSERGWYLRLRPSAAALPRQGWRIEIAATLAETVRVSEIVWGYCTARGLAFDVVRSTAAAHQLNSRDADRFESGRTALLYPADEAGLTEVLDELGALLDGVAGPQLLGALRHGAGPLHVSYGDFAGRTGWDGEGERSPVLERPDGSLVPVARRALFELPDWVTLPPVLHADLAALGTAPTGEFGYRIERALNLANGGGCYQAVHQATGQRVLLREARPHTGLDHAGADAVARLHRERAVLDQLAGLDCVARLVDQSEYAGHHFLATEYVEGRSLLDTVIATFPLTSRARLAAEAADYTRWALDVIDRVAAAQAALRARGLRLGQLHPSDVLLRPDGRVVLVDLGSATGLDRPHPPEHGEPGFAAPADSRGAAADRYLLDRLRLWLFQPLPALEPAKLPTLAAAVAEHFPVPAGFTAALLTGLCPDGPPGSDPAAALLATDTHDWPAIRDSLVAGIHAMATPDRPDRLFPGGPAARTLIGGHTFGYGAAGVLYALHRVGADIPPEYTDWLVAAADRDRDPRPGLYDGLHGVALTLDLLGRRDRALELLERCPPTERADLAAGRAGIALNLLHFADVAGVKSYRDRALALAEKVAAEVRSGPLPAGRDRHEPYGLLHGATGIALLQLRLHEETGEEHHLDTAELALARDLARLRVHPDETVMLDTGVSNLPYLHGGSVGLAFVLGDLLRHRPDPRLAIALTRVLRTCAAPFVGNSGLLRGRAGFIAALAAFADPTVPVGDVGETGDVLRRQIQLLAWHARDYRGQLAFPGFRSLRLSADLATGSAGVLLALDSAFERTGPVLPYLGTRLVTTHAGGR